MEEQGNSFRWSVGPKIFSTIEPSLPPNFKNWCFSTRAGPKLVMNEVLLFTPYINGFISGVSLGSKESYISLHRVVRAQHILVTNTSWATQTSSQVFDVVLVSAPGFSVMTWTNQQLAAECLLLDFLFGPKKESMGTKGLCLYIYIYKYIYISTWMLELFLW